MAHRDLSDAGLGPYIRCIVTLPSAPSQPIATPSPSGSTSSSLNGAFFGGTRFEKGKWSADGLFMWTPLSAQRKTHWSTSTSILFSGTRWQAAKCFPTFMWRAESGGWRWTFMPHRRVIKCEPLPGFWVSHWSHLPSTAWQKVADPNPRRRRGIRRRFRRGRDRHGPRRVAVCSSFRDCDGVRGHAF